MNNTPQPLQYSSFKCTKIDGTPIPNQYIPNTFRHRIPKIVTQTINPPSIKVVLQQIWKNDDGTQYPWERRQIVVDLNWTITPFLCTWINAHSLKQQLQQATPIFKCYNQKNAMYAMQIIIASQGLDQNGLVAETPSVLSIDTINKGIKAKIKGEELNHDNGYCIGDLSVNDTWSLVRVIVAQYRLITLGREGAVEQATSRFDNLYELIYNENLKIQAYNNKNNQISQKRKQLEQANAEIPIIQEVIEQLTVQISALQQQLSLLSNGYNDAIDKLSYLPDQLLNYGTYKYLVENI